MISADDNSGSFAAVLFSGRLPRAGGAISECEDRFAWTVDGDSFRVAVADGASASLLAGEWAQILVDAYCAGPDDIGILADRLSSQGDSWRTMVAGLVLPWYAVAKRDQGAFAALVGLSLKVDGGAQATAGGDSCVFQIRRREGESGAHAECICSHPFTRSGQFSSTPQLIGTSRAWDPSQLLVKQFSWEDGDDIYLMSDALAEWFLGEVQQKREPWRWFDAVESRNNGIPFDRLVSDLRQARKLKDDDVTLVHIRLTAGERRTDN